jgi:hypothetical protein
MMKFLAVPALAVGLAAVTPAFAGDDYAGRINVPREQWLSVNDVIKKISDQGYKVTKVEVDDGTYEFEGTNADGVYVEAHVHPATGAILLGYDD